jgi:hypothetical protein
MRVFTILLLGATLALCGCSNAPTAEPTPLTGKIGQNCTVQFRRGDALGGAASTPASPTTNAINGAEVCISGKLQKVEGRWIVVAVDNFEYCIPRESILLIQFNNAK